MKNQISYPSQGRVSYWLQGEDFQNYGDYLSEYFLDKLFTKTNHSTNTIHIIGSVISDYWINTGGEKIIFWGCGMRDQISLNEQLLKKCEFLSVRGPLSRLALGLDKKIPCGDPALLLPMLHNTKKIDSFTGKRILIPHFFDCRENDELLALSGCDIVLRAKIPNSVASIELFINQLTSAEFVLAGALHGAITAVTYGTPFGYWDSGQIDIPFKWKDFSESVGIQCVFHRRIESAESFYKLNIEGQLKIPPLLPLLNTAPFPIQPNILNRVILSEICSGGISS